MFFINLPDKRLFSFFVIVATITLTISCSSSGIKEGYIEKGKPILINLDSGAKHYSLASLIDSLKIVDLETTDNSIISDPAFVKRVIYKDDKFFVFDQRYFSIKVFNSQGKYLYDIGKLGVDRGQSLHMEDIELDFHHNLLMVLSNRPTKILQFTLDGHLVKEDKLDFFASSFAFPSDNSRVFYVNQNKTELSGKKNILLTDSNDVIKCKMFDFPKNIFSVSNASGGLYSTGQGIYFNPIFSDTFYRIVEDTAKAVFKIDYGSRNIPAGKPEMEIYRNLRSYSCQASTFATGKEYIGFNYLSGNEYAAFLNTHSGNIATSDLRSDSLNILFSNSMFENDGRVMMILDMNRLSGFLQRNAVSIQQRFPDLHAHMSVSKTKRNPLLLTFTLKTF
ncbi:MAG: 6-bladed beta-propeller [Bacteroidetes bacterium]|nr:6-bladed beta-propeller [Bacteroidota bacterium]